MPNQTHPPEGFVANDGTNTFVYTKGQFVKATQDASGRWVAPMAQVAPSKSDEAALKQLSEGLVAKATLADRAQQFMATQGAGDKAVATGPIYGKLPFTPDGMSIARGVQNVASLFGGHDAQKLSDLDSLNGQTWAMMRPSGSGPIRTIEAQAWKKAFPSTSNFGGANADISNRLVQEKNDAAAHLAFVNSYIRTGKGGFGDAEMAWGKARTSATNPAPPSPAAQAMPGQPNTIPTDPKAYQAYLAGKYTQ